MSNKAIKPFLRIIRDSSPYGVNTDVDVYVNNRYVGSVGYDSKVDFPLTEGVHKVHIKMQHLHSSTTSIEAQASPNKMLAMKAYKVKLPPLNPLSYLLKRVSNKSQLELIKTADDGPVS